MIPEPLRELAYTAFSIAGGEPSTWPAKVEAGLYGVIVAAIVGLLVIGVAWRRT